MMGFLGWAREGRSGPRPVAPHRTRPNTLSRVTVSPLCSLPPAAFKGSSTGEPPGEAAAVSCSSRAGRGRCSAAGAYGKPSGRMRAGAAGARDSGTAEVAPSPHRASAARRRPQPAPRRLRGLREVRDRVYLSLPFQLFPRRDLKSPGTNWAPGPAAEWGALIAA